MKKKIVLVFAVIAELSVYSVVYYFGYQRGKQEAENINNNIQLEITKIARNDK